MAERLLAVLLRECALAWARRQQAVAGHGFVGLIACLLPLALSPERATLAPLAVAMGWLSLLLALLLTLPRLFEDERRDGCLAQLRLSGLPTGAWVAAKIVGWWLTQVLPLLPWVALLALQFGLDGHATQQLLLSLLLGTPGLLALCAVGAALVTGARQAGPLLLVLVLPWCAPFLLFGCETARGTPGAGSLLAALSLLACWCGPWLTGRALLLVED